MIFRSLVISLSRGRWLIGLIALLPALAAQAAGPTGDFAQGTWTFTAYGSATKDVSRGDSYAESGSVGVGYYFRNTLSLSAEISGYGVQQEGEDAAAGGLGIMLRHHFLRGDGWSVYSQVGAGVFESSRDVPPGGTQFNFTQHTGLGFSYRLRENVHLFTTISYFHLSNARIRGQERNPSINGIEAAVGIEFLFK
ncbi:MAG TPA: acyloxyacyl hydrolase [Tepidisphaeraceae bacterium]|jgi:hypothetical protein